MPTEIREKNIRIWALFLEIQQTKIAQASKCNQIKVFYWFIDLLLIPFNAIQTMDREKIKPFLFVINQQIAI